jgi:hypothetical protein
VPALSVSEARYLIEAVMTGRAKSKMGQNQTE